MLTDNRRKLDLKIEVKMDTIFDGFKKAYGEGLGYDLSMTLSPIPPPSDPERLKSFFRSTNHASAKADFKYQILYDSSMSFKLPTDEGNAWVEVYFAYWKALSEILDAETASTSGAKVIKNISPISQVACYMIIKVPLADPLHFPNLSSVGAASCARDIHRSFEPRFPL